MSRALSLLLCVSLSLTAPAKEYTQKDLNEEAVIAGNWQHLSPEYDALFHQVFNMARANLQDALDQAPKGKKLAIITDIDDTLVDGTIYFTSLTGTDQARSPERSIKWWNNQPTFALPGTVRFFNEMHDRDIEIFYISGRFEEVKDATVNTLTRLGFPVIDKEHILLQGKANTTLGKEDKRQSIRDRDYHILMYFGDQLDDLAEVRGELFPERKRWAAEHQGQFGNQWYLLPNVVYGSWENAVAPDYPKLSPQEKHDSRIAALSDSRFHTITDPDYAQHLTLAKIWQHTSADYNALCYQAYNHAEKLISQQPADSYDNPAIVVDIDGTVLDFTTIGANLSASPEDKPEPGNYTWFLEEHQYTKPIPGAMQFLNSAKDKGFEIFYVSGRPLSSGLPDRERDIETATIEKLKAFEFPFADSQHVLLQHEFCENRDRKYCGKELKRKAIQEGSLDNARHDIVLEIGDLLSDFSLVEQGLDPRYKDSVAAAREQFGTRYIILPNPVNTVWMWQLYSIEAQKRKLNFPEMNWQEQAQLRRELMLDWENK